MKHKRFKTLNAMETWLKDDGQYTAYCGFTANKSSITAHYY